MVSYGGMATCLRMPWLISQPRDKGSSPLGGANLAPFAGSGQAGGLIYTIHEDHIYIAATMHLKRKPGYGIGRAETR
jgi:hypothetical protein